MNDLLSSILKPLVVADSPSQELQRIVVLPECLPSTSSTPSIPVVLHNSSNKRVPLCLFHDGSGQIDMYARLNGNDRITYAFMNPYFGSEQRAQHSLEGMAKQYVESLLSYTAQSSVILGGK
jgi:hypothetical protein